MSDVPFLRALPGAFAWPFQSSLRIGVLAGFAAGMAAIRSLPWFTRRNPLPFLFALLAAAAVSYLFGIVRRTTHADARPETLANELDLDDAWEDLAQFLGAFLVAYLPLLGFLGYALAHHGRPFGDADFRVALATTAVAGTAYFPMALLLLGFSGEWTAAFNLPLGLRGMARLGVDYAYVVLIFLVAAGLPALMELGWAVETPILSGAGWVARASTSFVEGYLAMAAMRALGLLYVARGDRLDWVTKEPRSE